MSKRFLLEIETPSRNWEGGFGSGARGSPAEGREPSIPSSRHKNTKPIFSRYDRHLCA